MTFTFTINWLDLTWLVPLVLYSLWWNFIATMSIRDRWDKLSRTNKVLAGPPVLVSFLQDVVANIIIATLLALELPRQWTLTERFQRWKTMGPAAPRRAAVAARACRHINQFDEDHC